MQVLGTVIAAEITSGDTDNTFSLGNLNYFAGGHKTAATTADRDAITTERRMEGMTCWVVDIQQLYRLVGGITNSNWVLEVTPAVSPVSGSWPLGNGDDSGSVTGLGLGFTPSRVILSISRPSGGLMIFANDNSGTLTTDGFDFELSGMTDSTDYVLNYVIFP